MFDFLKKKISGFVNKVTGKEEKQSEQAPAEVQAEEKKIAEKKSEEKAENPVQTEDHIMQMPEEKIKPETKTEPVVKEEKPVTEGLTIKPVKAHALKEEIEKEKAEPAPEPEIQIKKEEKQIEISPIMQKSKTEERKHTEHKIKHKEKKEEKIAEKPKSPVEKVEEKTEIVMGIPKEMPKEKERQIKVGIFDHLKSIVTGEIEIGKKDVNEMLESLELELIESDVTFEVAESIKQELAEKIVGKKIKRGELNNFIKNAIKETLLDILANDKIFDIIEIIKTYNKPAKIMFIGTNGSGKTTTIAKIGKMLIDADYKVVLAAADTFRAAAIEQLAIHAERLNIKIIKRDYGGDPTAVAYDAVSYANAHAIDVVLIDTAGRQESNYNLLNEMKKMQRIIKPDLKIYIGESIAGNALISQVSEFNNEIGVDAVILTKLDCDAKGGTVISVSKATGIPVIYLGTGQRYSDIEKFDALGITGRILG